MTGKVYQVVHKGTGEKYALKCMEMRRIDPELLDDLRNEIELLKLLDHPNVIKLYEYLSGACAGGVCRAPRQHAPCVPPASARAWVTPPAPARARYSASSST